MDKRLLDILCCPSTRQPLQLLDGPGLDAINRAVTASSLRRADGSMQAEPLREGLLTRDRKILYRIDDGIPVLLSDESISTTQVTDFPG
ncbi:MAG: Trm112 family protein [Lysobacteraceae bacterium]